MAGSFQATPFDLLNSQVAEHPEAIQMRYHQSMLLHQAFTSSRQASSVYAVMAKDPVWGRAKRLQKRLASDVRALPL